MSKYEEIKSFENDIKPNRFVCDAIIWVSVVMFVINFLNEFDLFKVDKWRMRIPFVVILAVAIVAIIVVRNKKAVAKPITKVWLMQMVMVCTMVASVCLDQFCYVAIFFPIVCAVVYHNKSLFIQAIIGVTIIAFSTPLLCLLFKTWSMNFFAVEMGMNHYVVTYTYDPNYQSAFEVLAQAIGYISIPRCAVVGVMSVAMYYSSKNTYENIESRAKIEYIAERDALTGLYNRQSFENKLAEYRKKEVVNKIGCVYGDADGLHEINNIKGHQAGDKFLIACAEVLNETFFNCNIYRVGGDEFVILTENISGDEINVRVEQATKILNSKGYHLSLGANYSENCLNITDLVNIAESRMFEIKDNYYKENNKEVRNKNHNE